MGLEYSVLNTYQSHLFLCALTLTLLVAPIFNILGQKEESEEIPDNVININRNEYISENCEEAKKVS